MKKVAVLIETQQGLVKKTNFGVITAARDQGCSVVAFVPGTANGEVYGELERYGVDEIVDIHFAVPQTLFNPDLWTRAICRAMAQLGIGTLLGLSSGRGLALLPMIAAKLDAPLVMDCTDIDLSKHLATKPCYSGKAVAKVQLQGEHFIYGLRPNALDGRPAPSEADRISFQSDAASPDFEVIETQTTPSQGVDLSEANVIISGGRAMANGENFTVLRDCAEAFGNSQQVAVGASRAAVDAGWVPHTMQVGQTGTTVNPQVYIACGISGSVQHFAGMKTAGMILAVNTDPKAAIISKCDYYIVADLFEFVPQLTAALKEAIPG